MIDWDVLAAYASGPLVTWLARRHPSLSWHDAQDAASEALARTWQHRDEVEPERVRTWINAVANRLLIDRERRQLHHPMLPLLDDITGGLEVIDTAPGPDAVALADWQAAAVRSLLADLPARQSRVLWMHHGLGQPYSVLSAAWGETERAIKMQAHYGRVEARARWAAMEAA
jgi:RNA polymerase sigma factor (sigma-70 family)